MIFTEQTARRGKDGAAAPGGAASPARSQRAAALRLGRPTWSRAAAVLLSALAHLVVVCAILANVPKPELGPANGAVALTLPIAARTLPLVRRPRRLSPGGRRTPAAAAKPAAKRLVAFHPGRPVRQKADHASAAAESGGSDEIGDAELAGAASAGLGSGGDGCDMAIRLEQALKRDHLVQAALRPLADASSGSRAFRVWDGDWTSHRGQDGRGLAAVREAILWEVGFAPKACREEEVRGAVLIVAGESEAGGVRVVLGEDRWRWSDLLTPGGRSTQER